MQHALQRRGTFTVLGEDDSQAFVKLHEQGVLQPGQTLSGGYSSLHYAAHYNALACFREALVRYSGSAYHSLKSSDPSLKTLTTIALQAGHPGIYHLLQLMGYDQDAPSQTQVDHFQLAAQRDAYQQVLLDNPTIITTHIQWGIVHHYANFVRRCMRFIATHQLEQTLITELTASFLLACQHNQFEAVKLFANPVKAFKHSAMPVKSVFDSPLYWAVANENTAMVEWLVAKGFDPHRVLSLCVAEGRFAAIARLTTLCAQLDEARQKHKQTLATRAQQTLRALTGGGASAMPDNTNGAGAAQPGATDAAVVVDDGSDANTRDDTTCETEPASADVNASTPASAGSEDVLTVGVGAYPPFVTMAMDTVQLQGDTLTPGQVLALYSPALTTRVALPDAVLPTLLTLALAQRVIGVIPQLLARMSAEAKQAVLWARCQANDTASVTTLLVWGIRVEKPLLQALTAGDFEAEIAPASSAAVVTTTTTTTTTVPVPTARLRLIVDGLISAGWSYAAFIRQLNNRQLVVLEKQSQSLPLIGVQPRYAFYQLLYSLSQGNENAVEFWARRLQKNYLSRRHRHIALTHMQQCLPKPIYDAFCEQLASLCGDRSLIAEAEGDTSSRLLTLPMVPMDIVIAYLVAGAAPTSANNAQRNNGQLALANLRSTCQLLYARYTPNQSRLYAMRTQQMQKLIAEVESRRLNTTASERMFKTAYGVFITAYLPCVVCLGATIVTLATLQDTDDAPTPMLPAVLVNDTLQQLFVQLPSLPLLAHCYSNFSAWRDPGVTDSSANATAFCLETANCNATRGLLPTAAYLCSTSIEQLSRLTQESAKWPFPIAGNMTSNQPPVIGFEVAKYAMYLWAAFLTAACLLCMLGAAGNGRSHFRARFSHFPREVQQAIRAVLPEVDVSSMPDILRALRTKCDMYQALATQQHGSHSARIRPLTYSETHVPLHSEPGSAAAGHASRLGVFAAGARTTRASAAARRGGYQRLPSSATSSDDSESSDDDAQSIIDVERGDAAGAHSSPAASCASFS